MIITGHPERAPQGEHFDTAAEVLSLVRICEEMHVLPKGGGLLDQDDAFVHFLFKIKEYDGQRQHIDQQQQRLAAGG